MFRKHTLHAEVDLHGASVEEAERQVKYWISNASRNGVIKIRFVTGRGNHINSKGERGVLYKNFQKWIDESNHKDRVDRCESYDGYYEIYLKPTHMQTPSEKQLNVVANKYLTNNIAELKARANKGEPYFQVLYAKYLETTPPVSHKEVFNYFRLAAEQNFTSGMYELARCYFHGIGVRQSDKAAFDWLEKAHRLGDISATVALGDCYWLGHGVDEDACKATAIYAVAAARNHPIALRKLAFAYKEGLGVQKNREKAFELYKKSADLGEPTSQFNVAVHYLNGDGMKADIDIAYKYFLLSAQGGDPDAQFKVGEILLCKIKNATEKKTAMEWLKKAATNGSTQANSLLATIGDKSEETTYLKKSAESGNFLAKVQLEFKDKPFNNVSKEEFEEVLQKSMRDSYKLKPNDILLLDHTTKFLLLDSMLFEKKHAYREKAFNILSTQVESDCVYSLRRMVFFYLNGFSGLQIKKDYNKAVEYLKKGVALKDSYAMVLLGYCYENGLGVDKSAARGLLLYQEASKYNNPTAYFNMALSELYETSNPNLHLIIEYLELAVKYESDKSIMNYLCSGLINRQQPITDRAKKLLEELGSFLHLYGNEPIMPFIMDPPFQTEIEKTAASLDELEIMLNQLFSTTKCCSPIYEVESNSFNLPLSAAAIIDARQRQERKNFNLQNKNNTHAIKRQSIDQQTSEHEASPIPIESNSVPKKSTSTSISKSNLYEQIDDYEGNHVCHLI